MKVEIDNLTISFPSPQGLRAAVRGVSLTLGAEKLGIVGESGSGKSLTARALLRLLPGSAVVRADKLNFDGIDILKASERDMRAIRGRRAGLILQDPKYALNPIMTAGAQIAEAWQNQRKASRKEAMQAAIDLLAQVQIRDPKRVAESYPHELSGGMGQRVMIAMMLIAGPELLIADEPTSALDVTVQLEVLNILDILVRDRGMGLIFISHDLRLVSTFCDRVLVMYAGRVVEELVSGNLESARHPYTRGLLDCVPKIGESRHPLPVLDRKPEWAA